jgi:uncharacterized protein (DUF362 family)
MQHMVITRRHFLTAMGGALVPASCARTEAKPVVSIVRIRNGKTDAAVEQAIDLLGGIRSVTRGKERIFVKPNLVGPSPTYTTKPVVVETIARLMRQAGKDVRIGEASASGPGLAYTPGEFEVTSNRELLSRMQQGVFDKLGYTELAKKLKLPLVNLHVGDLRQMKVPGGFVFQEVSLHPELADAELLCSVPMMKTHILAGVTLGLKNLIGAYPGQAYKSLRYTVHDEGAKVEPSAAAATVVDMARVNKMGLVVIDGSEAMEGNGPSAGTAFRMDVIVAGTNPLATDMVASAVMGFGVEEILTFAWANKAGMTPAKLDDIEVRGQTIAAVKRDFVRPQLATWATLRQRFKIKELEAPAKAAALHRRPRRQSQAAPESCLRFPFGPQPA